VYARSNRSSNPNLATKTDEDNVQMTWKPRHEAHAIERVRVLFAFREPVPAKVVSRSSAEITAKFSELGFNSVEPVEGSVATIKLQPNAAPEREPAARNGLVMRRHKDSVIAEEVGFRDLVYGYMTTTYGRWEAMRRRLDEVLLPALDHVIDIVELDSMKLEYWDSFIFEGDPSKADISDLLAFVDPSIPEDVLRGSSAWHSHSGWFEGEEPFPVLINRNLDMVDRKDNEGRTVRALGVYTLVEKRSSADALDIGSARSSLDEMHNRSLLLFGNTISAEYREQLGIDLEAYK